MKGETTLFQAAVANAGRREIVKEILDECLRQVQLWGVQNRPAFTRFDAIEHAEVFVTRLDTDLAKGLCDFKMNDGSASWNDIILEEYMEARDEALAGETDKLRVELIQLAAVIVSAIQNLDSRARENDASA